MADQPLYELEPVGREIKRVYLGTDAALVSPDGVPCESADCVPADLWLVERSGPGSALVRNQNGLPIPERGMGPGHSLMTLHELMTDYANGEWNFYRQGFARVVVRAMNADVMPERDVADAVGHFGFQAVDDMLSDAGAEKLNDDAKWRLWDIGQAYDCGLGGMGI